VAADKQHASERFTTAHLHVPLLALTKLGSPHSLVLLLRAQSSCRTASSLAAFVTPKPCHAISVNTLTQSFVVLRLPMGSVPLRRERLNVSIHVLHPTLPCNGRSARLNAASADALSSRLSTVHRRTN